MPLSFAYRLHHKNNFVIGMSFDEIAYVNYTDVNIKMVH